MNKPLSLLLAAGSMLALVFTVSCSDDKDEGNTPPAKEYCKVGLGGPKTCLEMPKSECSQDFYKNNGSLDRWKVATYEVVNECESIGIVCFYSNDCIPGSQSSCSMANGRAFNTIKECEDYKKSL